VRVPWETWQQHRRYVVHVAGTRNVRSASIEPDHALPDHDRSNNSLPMK
jgi:hypothetical protein